MPTGTPIDDETEEKVVQMYLDGASGPETADEVGISTKSVYNILGRRGVDRRSHQESSSALSREQIEQAIEMYEAGDTLAGVADRFGVSKSSVLRALDRNGVDTSRQEYSDEDLKEAMRNAFEDLEYTLTVEEYDQSDQDPSASLIMRRFGGWEAAKKEAGIPRLPPGVESKRQVYDTGTISIDSSGHEQIRVATGDGRHHVAVHRLVALLDHTLDELRGKVVHHKNRIRWDNRPDNLEVMDQSEHVEHHWERGDFDGR